MVGEEAKSGLLGVKGLRTVWKSLDKQQGAALCLRGSDAVTFVF